MAHRSLNFLLLNLSVALVFLALQFGFHTVTANECAKAFIFFDLGETLIDTNSHDFNPMFIKPGALEHLQLLNEHGYPLGLITDVPENWGSDQPDVLKIRDFHTAKFKRLLNFTEGIYASDKSSWIGPKFNWTFFGTFENRTSPKDDANLKFWGRVILPYKTSERKKNGGVVMFQRARQLATQMGCQAVYETSEGTEIEPAYSQGLIPYWVGHEFKNSHFLPIDKIQDIVKSRQH